MSRSCDAASVAIIHSSTKAPPHRRHGRGHGSRGGTPLNTEQPSVPYGFCHCGCGERTKLAPYSIPRLAWVGGEPIRYINGHNARHRVPDPLYVPEDCGYETPCWIWQGSIGAGGYGKLWRKGKTLLAHRWIYEKDVGPIPEGLTLDHLCRQRDCVNPAHLEPVTTKENLRRGESPSARIARKTHCKRGHEFTTDNTYIGAGGRRCCRSCMRAKSREYQRRKRAKARA